jgi:dTDP-4-dehydrorhamnose reductase
MKVLLFGDRGQLGKCIKKLNKKYTIYLASEKKLTHKNILKNEKLIENLKIDLIINVKAYTNVEKAELNKLKVDELNVKFVKQLATISKTKQIPLIHISSDFIFDGKSNKPYLENSKTNPVNYYGLSKVKGENLIKKIAFRFLIIRTSKLFSEEGDNFIKRMIKHVKNNQQLNYIDDEYFCPTYSFDLARLILLIIPKIKKLKKSKIYHFTGDEKFTPYKIMKLISQILLKQKKLKKIKLHISDEKDLELLAKRPKYAILSNYSINQFIKFKRTAIKTAIKKVISNEN